MAPSPRKTRSSSASTRSSSAVPLSKKQKVAKEPPVADVVAKKPAVSKKEKAAAKRQKASESIAAVEKKMSEDRASVTAARHAEQNLNIPDSASTTASAVASVQPLRRMYACADLTDTEQVQIWRDATARYADPMVLDETEPSERAPSEAPTEIAPHVRGEIRKSTEPLSELSDIEVPTVKKKKTKHVPDEEPTGNKDKKMSKAKAVDKSAVQAADTPVDAGPDCADSAADDAMDVTDHAALLDAWNAPQDVAQTHQLGDVVTARTQAVSREPFTAQESKSTSRPKPRPKQKAAPSPDAPAVPEQPPVPSPKKKKGRTKAQQEPPVPAFVSEPEDDEREAALSSPAKPRGVRLTSQNLVEVNDVEVSTPKPAKFRIKVEPPNTPGVIELDDTPKVPKKKKLTKQKMLIAAAKVLGQAEREARVTAARPLPALRQETPSAETPEEQPQEEVPPKKVKAGEAEKGEQAKTKARLEVAKGKKAEQEVAKGKKPQPAKKTKGSKRPSDDSSDNGSGSGSSSSSDDSSDEEVEEDYDDATRRYVEVEVVEPQGSVAAAAENEDEDEDADADGVTDLDSGGSTKYLRVEPIRRSRASSRASSVGSAPPSDADLESGDESSGTLKIPRPRKPASTSSSSSSNRKQKFKVEDLPGGAAVQERWAHRFAPTLVRYQGSREAPWEWVDTTSVGIVQLIWNATIGDICPHTVVCRDVVHSCATALLYEWRKITGHAASRVVEAFFTTSEKYKNMDNRASLSSAMLQDHCFAYTNTLKRDKKGLFRSRFVLPVIALHLEHIEGAVSVTGLYSKPGEEAIPCGAIGLATAAVERMFELWAKKWIALDAKGVPKRIPQLNPQTGNTSLYLTDFREEGWFQLTNDYASSFLKMKADRRDSLLQEARQFSSNPRTSRTTSEVPGASSRATLVDLE